MQTIHENRDEVTASMLEWNWWYLFYRNEAFTNMATETGCGNAVSEAGCENAFVEIAGDLLGWNENTVHLVVDAWILFDALNKLLSFILIVYLLEIFNSIHNPRWI